MKLSECEILKAEQELLIYGTSFISIGLDGSVKHVPFNEVIKTVKEIDSFLIEALKLKENEK